MVISEKMLRLLVALALLIATVQCASACTPVSAVSGGACPHHKQTSPGCNYELAPATAAQPSVITVAFAAEAVEIPLAGGVQVFLGMPVVEQPSPPGLQRKPPSIFRI
jgi:hypothetical protein